MSVKISDLTALTGADAATGDLLPIVDVSENTTKRIRRDEFFLNLGDVLVGPSTELSPGVENTTAGISFRGAFPIISASRASNPVLSLNRSADNGAVANFRRDGIIVGSVSVTTTATAYNTSSDYRLKEDLQPVADACARLMALKPVNFSWKADGSRVDGFLAHEAQEVVPEAVTGQKDAVDADGNPEYQGIDQSKLVPLLVAALQEALRRIEALEG
jgi:hypothetical protein